MADLQPAAQRQLSALADVSRLLERAGFEFWLFGGWAVDFHVGAITREHGDVDLAVWLDDAAPIGVLLEGQGWRHAPDSDEDGGTGYERDSVRVELTHLTRDPAGRVFVPLRERDVLWWHEPLGQETRELLGVTAPVVPLALLRAGKSAPRSDPADAARDRADAEALAAL